MVWTFSACRPWQPLQIGGRYTPLGTPGTICRIDEQERTDEEGKRYIRFYVKLDDGTPGVVPVRRYLSE